MAIVFWERTTRSLVSVHTESIIARRIHLSKGNSLSGYYVFPIESTRCDRIFSFQAGIRSPID